VTSKLRGSLSLADVDCLISTTFHGDGTLDSDMPFIKLRLVISVIALCGAIVGCSPSTPSPTPSTTPSTQTPPFTLNGKILQVGTSNGIPSATVTLVDPSGTPLTTTTDANGAFSFSGLATSGSYTLQAVASGFVPITATITIPVASFTVNLAPVTPSQPPPILSVTGVSSLSAAGQTSQLRAIVTNPDGTTSDVTTVARWSSSNTAVAQVSSSGLVTAFSAGATVISATLTNESGALTMTVTF
jgi:hypothetical protein